LPDSDETEPPSTTPPSTIPTSARLNTFSSYEELKNFLINNSGTQQYLPYYETWGGLLGSTWRSAVDAVTAPSDFGVEYSTTNIQVAGVDEIDIVKTDGNHIYLLSDNEVFIMKAYPAEEAELLSKITFNDTYAIGLFIKDDRLAVIGYESAYSYRGYYGDLYYYSDTKTFTNIYDISNKTAPVLLKDFMISGNYFNSRMIGEYVYFIVSQNARVVNDTVILPTIYSEQSGKEIGATSVQYFNTSDSYFLFTTIVAMNVQNVTKEPTNKTILLGGASCMYVSLNNIYITFPKWGSPGILGSESTLICRIQIQNDTIEPMAEGEVPGYVLNQFSMDEHGDHFRIATTTGHVSRTFDQATSKNHVYILDMDLDIVGRLENLAPGERIYSARFMGARCYLVTFQKIDPLFVIDLSEPTDPFVLGKLKIPGYSDYLHPYDENHIIGIGKHTVEADVEDFAWYQGVKISLFDVSNVSDPRQMANYTIGDRGTDSQILRDHKAFLFEKSKNLLVIPVQVAEIDESQYPEGVPPYAHGTLVWQGAYVFNITLSNGLTLRGGITHQDENTSVWETNYWVNRALYIEDVLYTISNEKVKLNALEDLSPIREIEIP
jgi:uncharacterized secreted protein with C-terminal beta-propeller domain